MTTIDQDAIHDDVDLPLQIVAFADSGIDLIQAPWEDRTIDWDSFDLVVVRSPWNYVDRLDEFRHWLDARRPMTTIHNPVSLLEWCACRTDGVCPGTRRIPGGYRIFR